MAAIHAVVAKLAVILMEGALLVIKDLTCLRLCANRVSRILGPTLRLLHPATLARFIRIVLPAIVQLVIA